MRLEHAALQVADPVAVAEWYVQHLGCVVVRAGGPPNHGRFLAAGPVLIEIYQSAHAHLLDYSTMHPSQLHLAFESSDIASDRNRLLAAGASLAEDCYTTPAGDQLLMLRDPWGLSLQFVQRAQPMLD